MQNLLDQKGFVNRDDLFNRMVYNRPNNGVFVFTKLSDKFSELSTTRRLFRIYTGAPKVADFVFNSIEEVAKSLNCIVRTQ